MPALTLNTRRSRGSRAAGIPATLGCLAALVAAPALAQAGADGEWTMPAKDYASTRFSGLSEITPATRRGCAGVDSLPACSAGTRANRWW